MYTIQSVKYTRVLLVCIIYSQRNTQESSLYVYYTVSEIHKSPPCMYNIQSAKYTRVLLVCIIYSQ